MSEVKYAGISIWKNKYFEEGSKKPQFTGTFVAPRDLKAGETIRLSIWKSDNRKSDSHPVMTGKEDTYKKNGSSNGNGGSKAPAKPDFDDDLPW